MKSGDELRRLLKEYCKQYKWKYEAAKSLYVNPPLLSNMLHGSRPTSDRVAKKLGYVTVRMYREI